MSLVEQDLDKLGQKLLDYSDSLKLSDEQLSSEVGGRSGVDDRSGVDFRYFFLGLSFLIED
jgi:hypothetical protein